MMFVKLIGPDGSEQEYPEAAKAALLAAGFTEPAPPQMENTILVALGTVSTKAAPGTGVLEIDAVWLTDEGRVALLATGDWAWKVPEDEVGPATGRFLVRGETTMIAEGLPEAAVTAMLGNGYAWADEDPNAAPVEPADDDDVVIDISGAMVPMKYKDAKGLIQAGTAKLVTEAPAAPVEAPYEWPTDDAKVEVLVTGVDAPMALPFKDARGMVEQGTAKIVGDDELQVRIMDAFDKADDKAVAADARSGAETMDPPQASPAGNLDKGLTAGPNASGKFTHPAIPDKEFATKGAVTQALNRLSKEGGSSTASVPATGSPDASAPPAAPGATGEDTKLTHAKNLLGQVGGYLDDFDRLLKLFDEVAGKRNIGEFTEAELDALVIKLEAEKAAAPA